MTVVKIIGQEPQQKKELKPIEFVLAINGATDRDYWSKSIAGSDPINWSNIDLICKNWRDSGLDLMRAYDEGRNNGFIVLGHFNDGVVE